MLSSISGRTRFSLWRRASGVGSVRYEGMVEVDEAEIEAVEVEV